MTPSYPTPERKQTTPLTLARVDIPALGPHELLLENVAIAQAPGGKAIFLVLGGGIGDLGLIGSMQISSMSTWI